MLRLLLEGVLGVLQGGRDVLIDVLQALLQLGILLFQCVIVLQGIADLIFELATFRNDGAQRVAGGIAIDSEFFRFV